jgi:acyl carrier protein
MNKQDIHNRVSRALRDQGFETPCGIGRETLLIEDLGADSLDVAEFVLELNDAFDIEIRDSAVAQWRTVGDIVDCLARDYVKCDEPEGDAE